MNEILADCNVITFKFQIYPYYSYYAQGYYNHLLVMNTLNSTLSLQSFTVSADIISYKFAFKNTIQGSSVTFIFDPSTLLLSQTASYPTNIISFNVIPTNNILALYYDGNVCQSQASIKALTNAVEYSSYAIMIISALPCKIVGL